MHLGDLGLGLQRPAQGVLAAATANHKYTHADDPIGILAVRAARRPDGSLPARDDTW
ncbi:hypothetical protein GCM10023259_042670 [Thermocatellispora tengchongensis]